MKQLKPSSSANSTILLDKALYKLKIEKWSQNNRAEIEKLKMRLIELERKQSTSLKYLDKKIRVTAAEMNYLERENQFFEFQIKNIEENRFNYTYYQFLHEKYQFLLKEKILWKDAKSSRNERIVKAQDSEKQKEKLRLQGQKLESDLERYQAKYKSLVLHKNETGRGRVEKIVRAGKKIEYTKTKIQRNKINLGLCDQLKYEVLSPLEKFKKFFSSIEYRNQKVIWGLIFLIPFFIGILVFFLPSLIKTISWSFFDVTIKNSQLSFSYKGFGNFIYLFQSYTIDSSNIFKVAVFDFAKDLLIDLPVILIFSLIIATLLNTKFKGSLFVKAVFFIPVVFNFTIISDALSGGMGQVIEDEMGSNFAFIDQLSKLLMQSGIGESFTGFIISAVDRIFTIVNLSGIQILIFTAALQSIPGNLYEAAKVEGATKYETFWKITFPMVSPILLTGAIFTVVDSAIRSPIYRFLTFAQVTDVNYGLASSIAVVYLILNILIIGLIVFIMKGLVFYYDKR